MHTKLKLDSKVCVKCNKAFNWRKKWERDWSSVQFCSKKCKGKK